MSSQSTRAVALVVVLLIASLTPLAFSAAADEAIHLSTDVTHVSLSDGQSGNVTLTIHNNGTSIESYNVTINSAALSSVWEIIASEDVVDNVFPTWSKNTTIIVRLGEGGTPSDSGSFDIIVTEPDANVSSSTTVFVSVAPSYEPALENNWQGGIAFEQGENTNLTFTAWNYGSVEDTFLLDVEYEPDLATWWQNQTAVAEPWDEASGNETLMFTQPTNGTSYDLSNGAMDVSVEISPLESNVSYLLEVVAENDLGIQLWSWNDSQNGTLSMVNLSTTWLPLTTGNITMTGVLSSNGTTINSNSVQLCLYTLVGCGNATGNGTGSGTGNGTSSNSIQPNGLGGNLPTNWNVFWQTDELNNIAAGDSMQSTLQIEVPVDAEPDYYGFRLFIASTEGNISSSTLLVIEVTEEYEVSFAFLSQEQDFIPATSTNTTIQATNLGNGHQNYSMQLNVNGGPCTASLLETTPHDFDSGEAKDIGLQLVVGENATASDSCDLTISAETDIDDTLTLTAGTFSFTIGIDELVNFTIVIPNGGISVNPGTPLDYEVRVNNSGSEPVTYYLDVANNEGLTTLITSSTGVLVESGQVGLWTVSTDADIGQLGQLTQQFSITYSGLTVSSDLSVDVQPIASLEMNGPLDGRISVKPGQSSTIAVQLTNTGTKDLSLVASLSGLPAGAELELSHSSAQIDAGQSLQVNLTINMLSNGIAGSHMLTFSYGGNGTSASLSIDLQISQKVEVLLSGTTGRLVAGPLSGAEMTFDVTNLGTISDTLHIGLEDNGASQWFEFILSSTSVSLDAGASSAITLGVREASSGAPSGGMSITLIVSSSSDTTVTDSMNLTIESLQAGATITVISDDDSAKPGETIHGSVVVTNSGTGTDNLLLTTVADFECGISELINLDAGASSQAFSWSCMIPENSAAGISYFNFRVTSSARTTFVEEVAEVYTVEPIWSSQGAVFITIGADELSVPNAGGSSMILTISNQANSVVNGNLSVVGMGDGLFSIEWNRLSDQVLTSEYTLSPGQSADFSVQFNSLVSTKSHAELTIRAISQIDSSTNSDDSRTFTVDIEGPQLPPSGVSLPLGLSLSNSASINILAGGWLAAIILLVVVRTMRKKSSSSDELTAEDEKEDESESESEEEELGFNECRMSEDNKVSCPNCESKLGVPRGSTVPFRFSCPSCDNKIRVIE